MGPLRNIREFILRFDLFSTNATFRYKGEPSYESIHCGLFSLFLIGLFIAFFATDVISVLTKQQITATITQSDNPSSTKEIKFIRIAVDILNVTPVELEQHFALALVKDSTISGIQATAIFPLESCSLQIAEWNQAIADSDKYVTGLGIRNMLCTPAGSALKLFGFQDGSDMSQMEITISRCSGPSCSDDATFNAFVENHLNTFDFFKVRLYILDNIFNPEQHTPVSSTIEKDMFLSFTDVLASRGKIIFASYEINTDESIWPFQSINTTDGNFVQSFQSTTTGRRNGNYVEVTLSKSTIELQITRSYGKIDDLLSYIGGFFSIVFFVLYLFFGSFNEYRYELMVAENIFQYDGANPNVREKDMGLLGYFKYQVYEWLTTFGIKASWAEMEKLHQVRMQATEQLDVRYVTSKLRYLEQVLTFLHDESLLDCAKIVKPQTLSQAKLARKMLQYYSRILESNSRKNIKSKIYPHMRTVQDENKSTYEINPFPNINLKDKELQMEKDHTRVLRSLSDIRRWPQLRKTHSEISIKSPQEEEQKSCWRKFKEKFQDPFEDSIDSDDEEAELKILARYRKMKDKKVSQSQKIDKNIPIVLRMMLEERSKTDDNLKIEDC